MVTFKQGDIITMNFDPQAGHEQKGFRPALVVSNDDFNRFHNLRFICPITNTHRNFLSHINLDDRTKTTGVILTDQVRMLDVNARGARFIEECPNDILDEVVDIIKSFL